MTTELRVLHAESNINKATYESDIEIQLTSNILSPYQQPRNWPTRKRNSPSSLRLFIPTIISVAWEWLSSIKASPSSAIFVFVVVVDAFNGAGISIVYPSLISFTSALDLILVHRLYKFFPHAHQYSVLIYKSLWVFKETWYVGYSLLMQSILNK